MERKAYPFVFYVFCLVLQLNVFSKNTAMAVVQVKFGVVLDMNIGVGEMGMTCISLALSDFYASHGNYQTRLVPHQRDSMGDLVSAAAAALDLLKTVEVEAIIGPLTSMEANFIINLGDKANVPVITFSATSPYLTNFQTPYFFRIALSDSSQVQAISAIVQAYGWRQVVPICVDNEFGRGILPYLSNALTNIYVRMPYTGVIPSSATDDQIVEELYKLMSMQTRVFVVHMLYPLGSRLFTKAKELGMMSEDYAWIITDGMTNALNSISPTVLKSMLGVLGVRPYVPKTKELIDFEARYKNILQQKNGTSINQALNIFGLWAYDSATALAMAVENAAGVRNATFSNPSISSNATDLDSIGVSSAGLGLVQAFSNTTFTGLAGSFQLVNGQLQTPPYEVVNIVGPGARVVGYWTNEEGIVRQLNSTGTSSSTYSSSSSSFKTIIWPGDMTYPPKGWVLPVNEKKLRILVPVKDGFLEFVNVSWNSDNSTTVQGFCPDVFEAVIEKLPYGVPYEYIPFPAVTYDDIVYQIYLGNYDALVGDVTIIANRSLYVDFTLPFTESGVSMIAPYINNDIKTAWAFLRPLSWQLWLTAFCSFIFIGVLIWMLEHRINNEFRGPPLNQLGVIFWFSFSTMVFAQKESIVSNMARGVLIIWFFVVLILTQSYTASLSTLLTVRQLQPSVTDLASLIHSNAFVGYQNGSFVKQLLLSLSFKESKLVSYNSAGELNELFLLGSGNGGIAAAFDELPYLQTFLAQYCSQYTLVGPTYKTDGFGFVFPIGSPMVSDFSRAILNVTESDVMNRIETSWLGDPNQCIGSASLTSSSLTLESFSGLFMIVGTAAVLALISFLIQFLYEHRHVIRRSYSDSIWSRIKELFNRFNNRDLSSHTFKNMELVHRDYNKHECDCMKRMEPHLSHSSPTTLSVPSPPEDSQTSTAFPSPGNQTGGFRVTQDNAMDQLHIERPHGETSCHIPQQEIEAVDSHQEPGCVLNPLQSGDEVDDIIQSSVVAEPGILGREGQTDF